MTRIALVNMPFASLRGPSLALSQLAAHGSRECGERAEIEVVYGTYFFAQYLGMDLYEAIATEIEHHASGLGEWLFRGLAFPTEPDNIDAYSARYYSRPADKEFWNRIVRLRAGLWQRAEEFINAYRLDAADIVGFTSMFAQTVPSLAIARMLKKARPPIITVIGGANCEAPMGAEIAEHANWFDFVFSGPALRSFPQFVTAYLDDDLGRMNTVAGVLSKDNVCNPDHRRSLGADQPMDDDLKPEYGDFISAFDRSGAREYVEPLLFFETSRGCWWGERAHCTFCGLNGSTMRFRALSPTKAIEQFEWLFTFTPWTKQLQSVDNIMPRHYVDEVLPLLKPPPGVSLFYEIKVPLDEHELRVMAQAGVTAIQPGIESLSTATLKLMKKGTSAFQNVDFLMNCLRFGLKPFWNILIGFPDEPELVYEQYERLIPLLGHLPPPSGAHMVRFDRYSPYFVDPETYDLDLYPSDYYALVYPFPEKSLKDLAYYFVDRSIKPYSLAAARWWKPLNDLIRPWQAAWEADASPPQVRFCDESHARVEDTRNHEYILHELSPPEATLLASLARPARVRDLEAHGFEIALDNLRRRGLIFEERGRAMSLVVRAPDEQRLRGRIELDVAQRASRRSARQLTDIVHVSVPDDAVLDGL